ncbi:MAG: TIGR00266 family protein, partial [Actinobacteria bacterium]|nr:TIGR00266 family protein [Actinomycetota bacterium]
MQIDIKYDPAFAIAFVNLAQGESIRAEAGAMVSHTPGLQMETSTQGGFMKGLKRAVGGESFFMNTFTATQPGDQIGLAAPLPGDIAHWPLSGQTVYLQSGAYLASAMGVEVDSSWGGSKTFFSGEGLIVLKVWGTGDLLVSAYGAIHAIDLAPGQ